MREVERAVHVGIPVVPFRIEDTAPSQALEYFISAPHWLDALTPPLEQHLRRLADTVERLLGSDVPTNAAVATTIDAPLAQSSPSPSPARTRASSSGLRN